MEFEVVFDDEFLRDHVDRMGYNCLGECGRKFDPHEIEDHL